MDSVNSFKRVGGASPRNYRARAHGAVYRIAGLFGPIIALNAAVRYAQNNQGGSREYYGGRPGGMAVGVCEGNLYKSDS